MCPIGRTGLSVSNIHCVSLRLGPMTSTRVLAGHGAAEGSLRSVDVPPNWTKMTKWPESRSADDCLRLPPFLDKSKGDFGDDHRVDEIYRGKWEGRCGRCVKGSIFILHRISKILDWGHSGRNLVGGRGWTRGSIFILYPVSRSWTDYTERVCGITYSSLLGTSLTEGEPEVLG